MRYLLRIFLIAIFLSPALLMQAQEVPEPDSIPQDSLVQQEPQPVDDEPDQFTYEEDEDEKISFSLKSPYHTVVTHLYYLNEPEYDPEKSAQTLSKLDGLSDEDLQKRAIKLKEYLDGAGFFIDVEEIPRDPDYTDSLTGKHKYTLVPEAPSVYLYKKKRGWIYSKHTVNAIPTLHREVFPLGTLTVPGWGKHKLTGNFMLWQLIGIFVLLAAAFITHLILKWILQNIVVNIIKRFSKAGVATQFVSSVAKPISILILLFLLSYITPILQLPIGMNKYIMLTLRILKPVFGVLIFYHLVDLASSYFERLAEKTESTLDDQLIPLLRKFAKAVVIIVGGIFVLDNLDVDITALVAGISIGGLALALAAQDTVKNLFGSFMIFVDRPFQIGDWIIAGDLEGTVEEVGVRSTRIRTFSNSLIYIPNGKLADMGINNMGLRVFRRFVTRIGVTYDTPPELLETFVEGVREIVDNHPDTRKDAKEVWFNEMGASSLEILVYVFFQVPDWTQELKARQQLLLEIMHLAQSLNIDFAFPTQTLHVESFPEKQPLTPNRSGTEQDYRMRKEGFMTRFRQRLASGK